MLIYRCEKKHSSEEEDSWEIHRWDGSRPGTNGVSTSASFQKFNPEELPQPLGDLNFQRASSACTTQNQGLESSFRCWTAGQGLAQKECFFTDTGTILYYTILYYAMLYDTIRYDTILYKGAGAHTSPRGVRGERGAPSCVIIIISSSSIIFPIIIIMYITIIIIIIFNIIVIVMMVINIIVKHNGLLAACIYAYAYTQT